MACFDGSRSIQGHQFLAVLRLILHSHLHLPGIIFILLEQQCVEVPSKGVPIKNQEITQCCQIYTKRHFINC